MARARNIKPGFFVNEDLVELPFSTRLLFIGLWTLADRAGRLEDRPKRIKMALFPADNLDVDVGLNELAGAGFLVRYSVKGEPFIQVNSFTKHQNPHRDEKPSTMPAPCEHDANTVPIGLVTDSLIPDSLIPDSSTSAERAVISMPLADGTEFGVTQECIDEWTSAYPAIRVLPELAKMRSWCIANRAKRKTRRGIMAFCNRWLSSAHDRGGTISPPYETAKTRELMQKTEWIDAITGRNKQPEIIDITPTLGREAP